MINIFPFFLQVRVVFLDPITSLEQNEEGISSGFVLMMYQTTAVWMRANAHGLEVGRTTGEGGGEKEIFGSFL